MGVFLLKTEDESQGFQIRLTCPQSEIIHEKVWIRKSQPRWLWRAHGKREPSVSSSVLTGQYNNYDLTLMALLSRRKAAPTFNHSIHQNSVRETVVPGEEKGGQTEVLSK